ACHNLLFKIKPHFQWVSFKFTSSDGKPIKQRCFHRLFIITWRALRTPRRSQPKSQLGTSGFNSEPNENLLSSEDLRENDGLLQPENLTLGHMFRQKLSDGRKVTCRLLGVILEENTPEELQNQATVKSSVLEVVSEMTKYCNLYLMERVLDDESQMRVLTALENARIFTSGGLVKDKVLFCSTENGRMSFVRQLEPD
ncbi:peroxisome biogenesis protein 22-like, partial [Bidens hawaiensis]|uniref:peroxisome biogenesis protein 22-like n=1 Tax=Bidens hawaiensis TaxID=980011 RepID=UPI00404AD888